MFDTYFVFIVVLHVFICSFLVIMTSQTAYEVRILLERRRIPAAERPILPRDRSPSFLFIGLAVFHRNEWQQAPTQAYQTLPSTVCRPHVWIGAVCHPALPLFGSLKLRMVLLYEERFAQHGRSAATDDASQQRVREARHTLLLDAGRAAQVKGHVRRVQSQPL